MLSTPGWELLMYISAKTPRFMTSEYFFYKRNSRFMSKVMALDSTRPYCLYRTTKGADVSSSSRKVDPY
jgi:hypothetical protein